MPRLLAAALVTLLALPALAVTFNDGQVHVIDAANSFPFENVVVFDEGSLAAGPPAGGAPTVVQMIEGGEIGTGVNVFNGSVFNMSGGTIGCCLTASDSSGVTISDGVIGEGLELQNLAEVIVLGGSVGNVTTRNDSHLDFQGGTANSLEVENPSRVSISGGDFGNVTVRTFAAASIFDGRFNGNLRSLGGELNVFGGEFAQSVNAESGARVNISGGLLGADLMAIHTASIVIKGGGFNFPPGPIAATSGTLTGTLVDGTPLNVTFGRASTASIVLVPSVPSLGSWGLATLVLGIVIGVQLRVRRK